MDETILHSAMGVDKRTLFPVGGRTNVVRVAEALKDGPLSGVVCVADRDFDFNEESWQEYWWLVFYDNGDIEAMLIESEALARFLEEWASEDKLRAIGGVEGVRAVLRERVIPLSSLRAANARENLGLPFDSIEVMDVLDKASAAMRRPSLVGKFIAMGDWTHKELEEAMDTEPPSCPHTNEPLAKGRDLMSILSVLLRQMIGSLSKQEVQNRFVERSIRLAVRKGDLDGTPFKERLDSAVARATAS